MAPINPNFTARALMDYATTNALHTLMVRYDENISTATDALGNIAALLTAIDGLLTTLTIGSCKFYDASSDISQPVAWPGDPTYGSGSEAAASTPLEMRFMARGGDGRRVHWSIYGTNITVPGNYRIARGDNADVAAGIDSIEASFGNAVFLTITGNVPVMYQFVDVNFNSYWERQRRKSS